MIFRTLFGAPRSIAGHQQHFATYTQSPARCAWCNGTGWHPFTHLTSCDVCLGQGSILVIKPHRKCALCSGVGRRLLLLKCPACLGAGWAHAQAG